MVDRLTEEFVRSELAKEGWVLVSEWKTVNHFICIYNPDFFNGHHCKFQFAAWRAGKRPALQSLIDPTEYIRNEISKEGWHLHDEYKRNNATLRISNPSVLFGFQCKITWASWSSGQRPDIRSLVNPTEYVRLKVLEEGWILLNEYASSDRYRYIHIRKPDAFHGHVCKVLWCHWIKGHRPTIKSLINPTPYISECFAEEGWTLLNEYENAKSKLLITNPDVFSGHTCYAMWDSWQAGCRPSFQSIVNKIDYVRTCIESEGWQLLSDKCDSANSELLIKKDGYYDGQIFSVSWSTWSIGRKGDMRSMVNPTSYVESVLSKYGFSLVDETWGYYNQKERFLIKHNETCKQYSVSWSEISGGRIPGSPKVLIRNGISHHLRNRNKNKSFSYSKIFDSKYLEELNKKFPIIDPGMVIDHIIPISFYGHSLSQMRLANSVSNLRLLTHKDNSSRNNRLRASELDQYDLWNLYYKAENPKGYKLIEDRHKIAS